MTTDGFKYKRPFSPDDATEQQLQHWHTPDLTNESRPDTGRTNALNLTLPQARKVRQELEEEVVVKPLTAEDIEQIRQAAYDEGFAQGKEEGFSKGYSEGREQGTQDGLLQGQAEGKKQGLAQGEQELTERLAQLTGLIEQMQKPLASVDRKVEQQLLQLSLAMAQAVIAVEVQTNPKVILQAVTEATSALPLDAAQIRIRLHPDDMAVIEQFYPTTQLAERGWQLQTDATVAQGGCLVETARSSVDRSLSQRLQSSLEHFIQLQDSTEPAEQSSAVPTAATDGQEVDDGQQ
ncbi:MAG: flagellar assembly protein FliH [Gammaproteobacteria bacterium]|nr:flagellar assembly protein FliH [Gammaproteobacteria bacterium]MBU1556313.1 flagellar assembly protein FliH [Gammaproteobacteria bacterium]MBU2069594.1 flagellar assembly protein FliH [Gammaproteobacteria bacterium]MBU2184459.1 flagellar assembly protein FliH [Gammaproteobacteria bacterium]MBU2205762.1 flagellar assembly protein FliH [Gammaproteobacteria bacterium]